MGLTIRFCIFMMAARASSLRLIAPDNRSSKQSPESVRKYLMFQNPNGGLNNARLHWEMVGILALMSNRILVLPPPNAMYLQDWGPGIPEANSTSKVEDFLDLDVMKRGLRVMTFEEFQAEPYALEHFPEWARNKSRIEEMVKDDPRLSVVDMGMDYTKFRRSQYERNKLEITIANFKAPGFSVVSGSQGHCDLNPVSNNQTVLLIKVDLAMSCTYWTTTGFPHLSLAGKDIPVPPQALELLRTNFVWHPDSLRIARKIVQSLGMFTYNAVHYRDNDNKFKRTNLDVPSFMQEYKNHANLFGGRALFVTSDNPSIIDQAREEAAKSGIAIFELEDFMSSEDMQNFSRERINKLKGPIDQIVSAFAHAFVGSSYSTFSGTIDRIRWSIHAPQRPEPDGDLQNPKFPLRLPDVQNGTHIQLVVDMLKDWRHPNLMAEPEVQIPKHFMPFYFDAKNSYTKVSFFKNQFAQLAKKSPAHYASE